MKKLNRVLVVSAAAFVLLGCGKSMTGAYSLSETLISQTGTINSSCTTTQLSMTLIQSGKNITGTAVGQCYSESLTGTDAGNNQYNANLTLVPSAQYGNGGQTCQYSGLVSLQNNQITGTLVMSQPAAQPSNTPSSYGYSYCSTTVTLSGSLQQ